MNDLSRARLDRLLTGRFGKPYMLHATTGSTNDDALAWAARGAPEGALVAAEHQTAGRGRWDRRWLSRPGASLLFSVLLRPERPASALGLLTTAAGVAVAEGIEEACGLRCGLRWPNDVTAGGRKLAGVLVETRLRAGTVTVAVVGVGINVDWPAADLPPEIAERATSIASELGRSGRPSSLDRAGLLAAVLGRLEDLYGVLGSPGLLDRATQRSELLGQRVRVRRADGGTIEGTALRLVPSGALEIGGAGAPVAVESGEIEWLRPR